MEEYFGISYCFDKQKVHSVIDAMIEAGQKGYVCVADGVTLAMSHKNKELRTVLNETDLTVCDSGWVPMYLNSIYNIKRDQYCGSDLLINLVEMKKYKLMFIGATIDLLNALRDQLVKIDGRVASMEFTSLPFAAIDDFNYESIARTVEQADPDIIFVSLGMPKQEFFMYKLNSYLKKGILIGVGAAFKFHSGLANVKRAPQWMIKAKLEWLYRLYNEPEKQIKRCLLIITAMPGIYLKEYRMRTKKLKENLIYYSS